MKAYARNTDPGTSHEAAAKVTPKLRKLQQEVLDIFQRHRRLTDLDLQEVTYTAGSTYRTRRSELVKMGLLRNSGDRKHQAGANRIVWEIVL